MAKKGGFIWILLTLGFAALSAVLGLQLYNVSKQPASAAGLADTSAIATVNGETITKAQLYERMVGTGGPQALDELIREALIKQEARKANVTVSEAEIAGEFDKIKANFGSDAEFQMALAQAGLSEEQLKQRVEFNTLVKKLLEPRVKDKLTDQAVEEYYNNNKDRYATQQEEVHARHILVKTEEEARQVIARLKAGEDFATLAKELSTEPAAKETGGDLGFFGRGKMVAEFEKAAFELPVGQISEPVKSSFGWHVIEVLEHKQQTIPPLAEVRDKVRDDLMDQEIGGMMNSYLQELESNAKIQNHLEQSAAS